MSAWLRALLSGLLCGGSALAVAESPERLAEQGDWAAALGGWQRQLARNPEDAAARRGVFEAARRLGLPGQAKASGAALSEAERAALEGDRIALLVRHGRIDAQTLTGDERYRTLDQALAATESLAARLLLSGLHNTFGRIAALQGDNDKSRRHFEEALGLTGDRDSRTAAHGRAVREMARLGLLPQAGWLIEREMQAVGAAGTAATRPVALEAQLTMLRSEVELL